MHFKSFTVVSTSLTNKSGIESPCQFLFLTFYLWLCTCLPTACYISSSLCQSPMRQSAGQHVVVLLRWNTRVLLTLSVWLSSDERGNFEVEIITACLPCGALLFRLNFISLASDLQIITQGVQAPDCHRSRVRRCTASGVCLIIYSCYSNLKALAVHLRR